MKRHYSYPIDCGQTIEWCEYIIVRLTPKMVTLKHVKGPRHPEHPYPQSRYSQTPLWRMRLTSFPGRFCKSFLPTKL